MIVGTESRERLADSRNALAMDIKPVDVIRTPARGLQPHGAGTGKHVERIASLEGSEEVREPVEDGLPHTLGSGAKPFGTSNGNDAALPLA